jgi:ABC-2 type transport system ATP-binding protein
MPADQEISFEDIHKTYISDFKRRKVPALSGLTFHVERSEVFGIVGPNGAGKSTALKALMGFIKYDRGNISLACRHPWDPESHSELGYLPENPCLYDNLSIKDHLLFCGRIAKLGSKEIKQRTDRILETVNLAHTGKAPIRSYSKGMAQRAALAYALFHEPGILILDEPMSGLDPLGRQLVVDIIKEYNGKGHTILFCSHVLTDVERICNRIGIMNRGKLTTTITPDELRGNPISEERGAASPLESFFMDTLASDSATSA